jgi:cytidylate kinase
MIIESFFGILVLTKRKEIRMAVITISRELSSLGTEISRQVANVLGYQYVDKDIVEAILQQYGLIEFDKLYQTAPGMWSRLDLMNMQMIQMLNKTMLAFARRSNAVVLGRGGFAVFKDFSDVLNVRIQAPFDVRVERTMKKILFKNKSEAEDYVREHDHVRQAFIQTYYSKNWDVASNFNLVIDTGIVPMENAADWIVSAARELSKHPIRGKSTGDIAVDSVLSRTIEEILQKTSLAA